MDEKVTSFVRKWIWLGAILIGAACLLCLFAPLYSAKTVEVSWADGEAIIAAVSGSRHDVFSLELFQNLNFLPLIPFLVIPVFMLVSWLGKKYSEAYVAAGIGYLTVAILLLISNSLYSLGDCWRLLGADNVGGYFEYFSLEHGAELGAGVVMASVFSFLAAFMNIGAASSKELADIRSMAEVAVLSGLAIGLQFIKVPLGATGGSVNLGLIPLFMVALRHGPAKGFLAGGIVFGLVTCLTDGYGFHTYPFDYLVGFGSVAALGFFRSLCFTESKNGWNPWGFLFISIGIILASTVRFFGSTVSSMVNYGYAFSAAAIYNVGYIFITGAVSLGVMLLLYIPLARVNKLFPLRDAKAPLPEGEEKI